MSFDVISIIYIIILALFIVIGIKRGLFKSLINILKDVLSFVFSLLFAKPLANFLLSSNLGNKLTIKIEELLIEKNPVFDSVIENGNLDLLIEDALYKLNLPKIFASTIAKMIESFISTEAVENLKVAEAIAPVISYYIYLAISLILLFILIRIACFILDKIFNKVAEVPLLKTINLVFGGLLGACSGIIVICFISYAFTFIIPLDNQLSIYLVDQMKLNEDVFTLSKYIYNNNFLLYIITFIQGLLVK